MEAEIGAATVAKFKFWKPLAALAIIKPLWWVVRSSIRVVTPPLTLPACH